MKTFKLIVSYDGTNYHGWQMQKGHVSVQEILEQTIHKVTSENVRVHGSGRTDAGVHALGQVAHFRANTELKEPILKKAINFHLPNNVRILKLETVKDQFHAQFWAKSKMYHYHVWNGDVVPVFKRNTHAYHPGPLNILKMKEAVKVLLGRHDFSSFSVNPHVEPGKNADKIRHMLHASISKKGREIIIKLEADGFLYKMVRSIVGTLLDVGREKLTVDEFKKILLKKDRRLAGKTAPAKGLFLMKVRY